MIVDNDDVVVVDVEVADHVTARADGVVEAVADLVEPERLAAVLRAGRPLRLGHGLDRRRLEHGTVGRRTVTDASAIQSSTSPQFCRFASSAHQFSTRDWRIGMVRDAG